MLRFTRESEDFLERPAMEDVTAVLVDDTPHAPQRSANDHARFIPGDVVAGRYRISGLLGRGGMGEVYRADDLRLGQPVALKFLAESLATNGAALARFHREVSLARQISHRHVCRVYDIGEHAGMQFLSMEYVRGEELASLLKRVGRLPLEKAIETARQLCAGLAAIHAAGVLHRDLKPANVMIDEHGDVRITDFGIAALSEHAGGAEAMIGTPAYMAPEHFAGGAVTTRSDVYALGLVLYEIFTGRRAFAASSLQDVISAHRTDTAPVTPSTWIAELDPLVERVILRCLEKDPDKRPASALHVAAALPGGDPLAAALAAGETPSPQMVAAAAKEGSLRPLVATLLLLSIFAGFLVLALLGRRTSLLHFVPLTRSAELLRADAEEIAREAGHAEAAGDAASGFDANLASLDYVEKHERDTRRWERFRAAPLPAVEFWYRRSPRPLEPYDNALVGMHDPPNILPGMVRMRLDSAGKLLFFEAVPPLVDGTRTPAQRVDWQRLFERAGLTMARFQPATPRWTPPQHSDERLAWTGVHPQRPELPLRIEAAAYRGSPVYFEVVWPWEHAVRLPPTFSDSSSDPFSIVLLAFYFFAISLGVLLAWRNLRLGRGDRRGAVRLTLFIFVCRLVYWIFATHHVAAIGELALLIAGLQSALYWAAFIGMLYLALEPFVRRRWPEALISWTRLLAGDMRDPLVGRDVLIGGVFGVVFMLANEMMMLVPPLFGAPPRAPAAGSTLRYVYGLDGARGFLPLLINQTSASVMMPLIITTVVVFFVMLTRRNAIGIALSWVIFYGALNLNFGDGSAAGYVIGIIMPTVFVVALTRYGLLTLIATFFFIHLWPFYPITTDLTAWYATTFLLALAVLGGVAVFAFRIALGSQKVLSGAFLEP